MVLTKMKETTEAYMDTKVKHAVTRFSAIRNARQPRMQGPIYGLNVLRIISESDRGKVRGERNVLIHDMDGGTFDVSLLMIVEMKASASGPHLGGEDFENYRPFYAGFQAKKSREKAP